VVEREFLDRNEREKNVRALMAKMESTVISRLVGLGHG
jgi:hypothetical protein